MGYFRVAKEGESVKISESYYTRWGRDSNPYKFADFNVFFLQANAWPLCHPTIELNPELSKIKTLLVS